MPRNLVTLEGGPVPFPTEFQKTDKSANLVGFITTRRMVANTPSDAAALAIEDVLVGLREHLLATDAESPPCCVVQIRKAT